MKRTGFKDKNGKEIFEGDLIRVGMRRGDSNGWTIERILNARTGWRRWFYKPVWILQNPSRPDDGFMDMQRDEQLIEKVP